MNSMRLLLLSNSTMAGEAYLEYPRRHMADFLGKKPVQALFIPYAAVSFSFDDYETKVKERFQEIGHRLVSIHHFNDPVRAVEEAEAIVTGGGNTWQLVRFMHEYKLMEPIRRKVKQGVPYIGWSAGSNVACPTLRTTNDMPVTDPLGFDTIGLIPFQINPHYLDANPDGHAGETRQQRVEEFLVVNPTVKVIGLREGCMLRYENDQLRLIGSKTARLFCYGQEPKELSDHDDLNFLLA